VEAKVEYFPFPLGVANAGHSGIHVGHSQQNNENSKKSKDEREINRKKKVRQSPSSSQERHNDAIFIHYIYSVFRLRYYLFSYVI